MQHITKSHASTANVQQGTWGAHLCKDWRTEGQRVGRLDSRCGYCSRPGAQGISCVRSCDVCQQAIVATRRKLLPRQNRGACDKLVTVGGEQAP